MKTESQTSVLQNKGKKKNFLQRDNKLPQRIASKITTGFPIHTGRERTHSRREKENLHFESKVESCWIMNNAVYALSHNSTHRFPLLFFLSHLLHLEIKHSKLQGHLWSNAQNVCKYKQHFLMEFYSLHLSYDQFITCLFFKSCILIFQRWKFHYKPVFKIASTLLALYFLTTFCYSNIISAVH